MLVRHSDLLKLSMALCFCLGFARSAAADALSELVEKYSQTASETPEKNPVKRTKAKKANADRGPASTTKARPATARPEVIPAAVPPPTPGQTTAAATPPAAAPDESGLGLLGSWGGLKPKLSDKGANLAVTYKGELFMNMKGGLEKKSLYLGNVDVTGDFSLEKILGIKGLSMWVYGIGDHGPDPTTVTGDTLYSSNIEAPNTFKLYEAYLKQNIDDRFSLLLGLRDLNADYYSTDSSHGLINSSFGASKVLSQTGINGPSIFPTPALAMSAKYESPNSFFFQAGAFNATAGDPERHFGTHITSNTENGYLYIFESGFNKTDQYKFSLGAWEYSKPVSAIDSSLDDDNNWGFYGMIDYHFTKPFSAFIRHGIANPKVNRDVSGTEIGLTYKGLIPSRADDRISLGAASAMASGPYRALNDSEAGEYAVELSYRIEAFRGVALTPDYQYLVHPGQSKTIPDAQVGILRIEIGF